uniref:MD-2-related lipid-recognition domain-containing protein n=1 Tax=Anopheles dirus TaxID=7168 RepID=A0A182NUQ8_9DIPT
MLMVWLFSALAVGTLHGKHVDFERVEQLSGTDFIVSTLRVRKYNRTTIVLNGTLQIMQPLNTSLIISNDLFHSSLGNQQFNHYPMKLPTANVCEFFESFSKDYGEYLANVINVPDRDECPIVPRSIYFVNEIFPAKVIPRFTAPGLWKMLLVISLDNVRVAHFEIMAKVKNDLLE